MSKSLFRFENRFILASLTDSRGLDLYIIMVILSRLLKFSEVMLSGSKGCLEMCSNAGVTWLFTSHACYAVSFPIPKNRDVQLHPVNAWNTGNALDLHSPRVEQILLMLINEKWSPMPNATHS